MKNTKIIEREKIRLEIEKREGVKFVQLRKLKKGEFFKRLQGDKLTTETYTREEYDRMEKRFYCTRHSDAWGSGLYLFSSSLVAIAFTY